LVQCKKYSKYEIDCTCLGYCSKLTLDENNKPQLLAFIASFLKSLFQVDIVE